MLYIKNYPNKMISVTVDRIKSHVGAPVYGQPFFNKGIQLTKF